MYKLIIYGILAAVWINFGVACATYGFPFQYKVNKVDVDLRPYVTDYYKLLNDNCKSKKFTTDDFIAIEFVEKNNDWIGLCIYKINGYQIYINKEFWDRSLDETKRLLMYHELSHCVLGQPHIDDPYNYMYPYIQYLPEVMFTEQTVNDITVACQ